MRTFCETLHYTGCRISEALEITPKRVDLSGQQIILRTLKKRRQDAYRPVPVPLDYLDTLDTAFGLRSAQKRRNGANVPLWSWTRQHAWHLVKGVMDTAEIADGPHRTAKGVRHGYGINAIMNEVPLNMLSKWLGHADIKTTAIYANAVGAEEAEISARMWE